MNNEPEFEVCDYKVNDEGCYDWVVCPTDVSALKTMDLASRTLSVWSTGRTYSMTHQFL